MENSAKTLFLDIDGTLVKHENPHITSLPTHEMEMLDGTIDKLLEWNKKGYSIILTTGRRESSREVTIKQLQNSGIFYDQLIMGIGRGVRIVVNDKKTDGMLTAEAINLDRDNGIKNLHI